MPDLKAHCLRKRRENTEVARLICRLQVRKRRWEERKDKDALLPLLSSQPCS